MFDPAGVRPGRLDLTVIYQGRFWVDTAGRCWELTATSPAHRAAVVGFLHERAAGIHRIEAEAEDLDPSDLIEATPLVRALRRLSPDIPPPAQLRRRAPEDH